MHAWQVELTKERMSRSQLVGGLVSTLIPDGVLFGSERLCRWYDDHPYHRFVRGETLVSDRGFRTIAIVLGYEVVDEFASGSYLFFESEDDRGLQEVFKEHGVVMEGTERRTCYHGITKSIAERQYRKVSMANLDMFGAEIISVDDYVRLTMDVYRIDEKMARVWVEHSRNTIQGTMLGHRREILER
ncbi:hypothetical protein ACFL0V_02355 [Nanoarchaeota archaeon]